MKKIVIKKYIPSAITALRIAAAPLFYYVFSRSACGTAFLVFILAAGTDILDGYTARKLKAVSNAGAYLDVAADLILIVVVFTAFFIRAWYCWMLLFPILIPFIAFIASSGFRRPIYDPVGKYMGAFLMGMIVLSLLLPHPMVRKGLSVILLIFCVISLSGRIIYLYKLRNKVPQLAGRAVPEENCPAK